MNLLVAVLATSLLVAAPTGNREWDTDYAHAFASAKRAQRPLLVVLEKPDAQRQQVRQASFTLDERMNALLEPYELCRVDVTTPYGREVAKAFGATQFPLTAITDRTVTTLVFKKVGHFSSGEWVQTLVTYQRGERPQLDPGLIFPGQVQCFT